MCSHPNGCQRFFGNVFLITTEIAIRKMVKHETDLKSQFENQRFGSRKLEGSIHLSSVLDVKDAFFKRWPIDTSVGFQSNFSN